MYNFRHVSNYLHKYPTYDYIIYSKLNGLVGCIIQHDITNGCDIIEKSTTMILAVVAVALIVGGATVAIVVSNNNKGGESTNVGAALPVYGNADLDADIDGDDLNIINRIISKDTGYTLAAYPFADANKDGTVNQSDVDIVNKIIKKEKTSVYHLNYYNDGAFNVKTKVAETKWPCEDLMVTYNSIMFALTSLGVDDRVVGATAVGNTSMDKYVYSKIVANADQLKYSYDSSWNIHRRWNPV